MSTSKQRTAIQKTLENLGTAHCDKKSIGTILKESGYSPAVCKNPKIVTDSKGWKALLEEYLPVSLVLEAHRSLLTAKKLTKIKTENGYEMLVEPDNRIIASAIDMYYRLRGSYKENKLERKDLYESMSDQELTEKILEYESRLLLSSNANSLS